MITGSHGEPSSSLDGANVIQMGILSELRKAQKKSRYPFPYMKDRVEEGNLKPSDYPISRTPGKGIGRKKYT